jgi:hypothetical protein
MHPTCRAFVNLAAAKDSMLDAEEHHRPCGYLMSRPIAQKPKALTPPGRGEDHGCPQGVLGVQLRVRTTGSGWNGPK